MFEKRRRGYASLGYVDSEPSTDFELQTDPAVEGDDWLDAEQSDAAG